MVVRPQGFCRFAFSHAVSVSSGIDSEKEPEEIIMGYQCSNGGVKVDERGRTSVPGLWAAGEVAGGMHGADRIGGNILENKKPACGNWSGRSS